MTGQFAVSTASVLLAEDDAGDVLLTAEAFARHRPHDTLHVVGDGEQAAHFLHRTADFAHAPRPALILLRATIPVRPASRLRGGVSDRGGPAPPAGPWGRVTVYSTRWLS